MYQLAYDSSGRQMSNTDPSGDITRFDCHRDDHLAAVTDPKGSITRYVYHPYTGLLLEEQSPDSGKTTYAYDSQNNLIEQVDANGNRLLAKSTGADNSETHYTIENGSNRLIEIDGVASTYDANGNLLQDGRHSYRYDARNRLVAVDNDTTASYRYNALGQRVYKKTRWHPVPWADTNTGDSTSDIHSDTQADVVATTDIVFAYEGARLLGEYDLRQKPYREIIWMGDLPVAVVQKGELYQIYSDHLVTPVAITDSNNTIVWRWDRKPFGDTAANEDPDGDGRSFTFNLRLPGQYFDEESGLHYNYFRDYDPSLGRYLQSDPIGILRDYSDPQLQVVINLGIPLSFPSGEFGALNHLYGYVNQNPINFIDPFGLAACSWGDTTLTCSCKTPTRSAQQNCQSAGGIPLHPDLLKDNVDDDANKSKKDRCIERCSDTALPTKDNGFSFWNCVNRCMDEPDDCE
ncbi:MAG: RHS repeat domain-containing protein [Parahaliea sp.]